MMKGKIVVCGATGNQGGAVVQALLNNPEVKIIGLTRSVQSAKAKQLSQAGITMVEADLLNRYQLEAAFAGADAVFGVTQPWDEGYTQCNVEAELQQGRNIIAVAKSSGVQHLVFSSILSFTNLPMGVKHADSKLIIEGELKKSGLNYTILRCAQFMDNIGTKFFPVGDGRIKGFVAKDALVPYIACKDIGMMAAHVVTHADLFRGQTIDLIGDIVSGEQLAAIFSQMEGIKYKYCSVPALILRLLAPEFYTMRRTFEKYGRVPHHVVLQKSFQQSATYTCVATNMQRFIKDKFYASSEIYFDVAK